MGVHYPNEAPLTRRAFLRLSAVTAAGLALAACAPAAPTQLTEADSAKAASLTATPGQQVIAMAVSPIERLVRLSNSVLLVPETVVNDPKKTADYLLGLITSGYQPNEYKGLAYLNNPSGGIPNNDDPTLLTGKREPGQSLLTLDMQPLSYEARLYSSGQLVLPLSPGEAKQLQSYPNTVSEQRPDGKRNVHMIWQLVKLADGRDAILIPGGKDDDRNVSTPKDNVNRGNVLIVLPPTEQGDTALSMQVDSHSNWLAQFNMTNAVTKDGGIKAKNLISYLLFDSDAQRSEGHGMSTMTSMYKGPNCQGKGCRTTDDQGKQIADMAGIGIYILQPDPKAKGFKVLAATVLTDSEIPSILAKR